MPSKIIAFLETIIFIWLPFRIIAKEGHDMLMLSCLTTTSASLIYLNQLQFDDLLIFIPSICILLRPWP